MNNFLKNIKLVMVAMLILASFVSRANDDGQMGVIAPNYRYMFAGMLGESENPVKTAGEILSVLDIEVLKEGGDYLIVKAYNKCVGDPSCRVRELHYLAIVASVADSNEGDVITDFMEVPYSVVDKLLAE